MKKRRGFFSPSLEENLGAPKEGSAQHNERPTALRGVDMERGYGCEVGIQEGTPDKS